MAGGERDGREGRLGARFSPSDEPPQPLAEEEQPQPSPPQHGEEQEEDGEGEEESQRSEGRSEGVLDEDTAAEGLHDLGYSAPGTEYVYLHLSLPGRELSDISILSGYTHLQKLELSCNKIRDLSCISHMPYLIELHASKNELTTYFDFKPPKNLREVDFSHNQIPKMRDLSAYHSLTKLLLDYNEIEEIRGLEECHRLTQLGLSHNKLTAIGGLDNLPIRILNLSFNRIEEVAGLEGVKTLRKVDLSCNRIHSLRGLEGHDLLEVIDLEDNQVAELSELEWLKDLPLLRFVNLLKNPLQEKEEYWLLAVFKMLQITELDHKKISVEEKVTAVNEWDPPPEIVAARDHRIQVLCNLRQPQRVLHSTLADELYPMLVLLGPLACGKRELSFKICRKFKNSLRFGPCHSTRRPYFGEENRFDYYFVSQEQFDAMVVAGKFLVTYESRGHWYGLARNTVECIAREGLATCVHLEIEGVRSLKKTYFKPKYVLLVPRDKQQYEEHLRRKGLFTRPEIAEAVSRVDMYLQINQDCPEYFDAIVHTDDLEEAFEQLSDLMKLLLGLEPPGAPGSTWGAKSRAGCRARICPQERLSPGRRTPVSPRPPSRAYLQKRFSAACQALFWKDPGAKSQLFHRGSVPEPESSSEFFLKPKPPRPSDGKNVPQGQSFSQATPERRESIPRRGSVFVHADPALADGLPPPIPCSHLRRPGDTTAEPRGAGKESEVPGENLQRKCSRSRSGSFPVPQLSQRGSHPRPVLPPIPPGWRIADPDGLIHPSPCHSDSS